MIVPASFPPGRAPRYASAGAAGADLYANLDEPITIGPHSRAMVSTGVRIALPAGFEAQVRPRSGLAAKHGVTVLNAPGTIDCDYRGELTVILVNLGDEPYTIEDGDRVAQLIIAPITRVEFKAADLSGSKRGAGGFGSTGR